MGLFAFVWLGVALVTMVAIQGMRISHTSRYLAWSAGSVRSGQANGAFNAADAETKDNIFVGVPENLLEADMTPTANLPANISGGSLSGLAGAMVSGLQNLVNSLDRGNTVQVEFSLIGEIDDAGLVVTDLISSVPRRGGGDNAGAIAYFPVQERGMWELANETRMQTTSASCSWPVFYNDFQCTKVRDDLKSSATSAFGDGFFGGIFSRLVGGIINFIFGGFCG